MVDETLHLELGEVLASKHADVRAVIAAGEALGLRVSWHVKWKLDDGVIPPPYEIAPASCQRSPICEGDAPQPWSGYVRQLQNLCANQAAQIAKMEQQHAALRAEIAQLRGTTRRLIDEHAEQVSALCKGASIEEVYPSIRHSQLTGIPPYDVQTVARQQADAAVGRISQRGS